jgi:hypothetical protein
MHGKLHGCEGATARNYNLYGRTGLPPWFHPARPFAMARTERNVSRHRRPSRNCHLWRAVDFDLDSVTDKATRWRASSSSTASTGIECYSTDWYAILRWSTLSGAPPTELMTTFRHGFRGWNPIKSACNVMWILLHALNTGPNGRVWDTFEYYPPSPGPLGFDLGHSRGNGPTRWRAGLATSPPPVARSREKIQILVYEPSNHKRHYADPTFSALAIKNPECGLLSGLCLS